MTVFIDVISSAPAEKPKSLGSMIDSYNRGRSERSVNVINSEVFEAIPNHSFAYSADPVVFDIFRQLAAIESEDRHLRVGDHPGNKDKFVRLWWEISDFERSSNRVWLPYQKGGEYSPFYGEMYLVVDWDPERSTYYGFHGRKGRSAEKPSNYQYFMRPGVVWPLRTTAFSPRLLPRNCIISNKGPTLFVKDDDELELFAYLALMNSSSFEYLIRMRVAGTELARSYEVGLVQRNPIPFLSQEIKKLLSDLAVQAVDFSKSSHVADEVGRKFQLPQLLKSRETNLRKSILKTHEIGQKRAQRLHQIQEEVDLIVRREYLQSIRRTRSTVDENPAGPRAGGFAQYSVERNYHLQPRDEDLVSDLLMWSLGSIFGRWDIRYATDPSLLPRKSHDLDPLPPSSPGTLVEPSGSPASSGRIVSKRWLRMSSPKPGSNSGSLSPNAIPDSEYPLDLAWGGVLVDDPGHRWDVIANLRQVIALIWPENPQDIEREACVILGVSSLRSYFGMRRKGFFDFHIKRYSNSRRKAPIYWLLQAEQNNYDVWLYYHRLSSDILYHLAREYVDPKLSMEQSALSDLQGRMEGLAGAAAKSKEREVGSQLDLVNALRDFKNRLEVVAALELEPDLNDGVLLNIAPLHELVPWKAAAKAWEELLAGKHEWSTIAKQLRKRGLVKGS